LRIVSGVCDVGVTYIPIDDTAVFEEASAVRPIFYVRVDAMRPAFNLEPKYRVTMLNREYWTKGTGALTAVKGLVWFTDGSNTREGSGAGVYGQSVRRILSFYPGRYATDFQAEIYAILDCVYEIQLQKGHRNT
jgi:hypothetical protein